MTPTVPLSVLIAIRNRLHACSASTYTPAFRFIGLQFAPSPAHVYRRLSRHCSGSCSTALLRCRTTIADLRTGNDPALYAGSPYQRFVALNCRGAPASAGGDLPRWRVSSARRRQRRAVAGHRAAGVVAHFTTVESTIGYSSGGIIDRRNWSQVKERSASPFRGVGTSL